MATKAAAKTRFRFAVISTCPESWGGSEELWSKAAIVLAKRGHIISAFKTVVDERHPRIQELRSLSCSVRDLISLPAPRRLVTLSHFLFLTLNFKAHRPDLVVISQGDNYDGLHFGYLCRKLKLPYILISQKATDHFWPPDRSREYRRSTYEAAVRCFFVSEHNRSLTEDQIGTRLPNAAVVRNPFLVSADGPLPWPNHEDDCLRLACVARLYLLDKGQDILLRVLASEKWKKRNLHVSFFGQGVNREGLMDLATRLGVTDVSFKGQSNDVPGIWREHHALILPSRCEGLPLSLVEALMCGRPAIVTNVGGNAEVLKDGVTGFLAPAASEVDIDRALENAWQQKSELREMGAEGARTIRRMVSSAPEIDFAEQLVSIVSGSV